MQPPGTFNARATVTEPRGARLGVMVAAAVLVAGGAVLGATFVQDPALVWRSGALALTGASLLIALIARHLRTAAFGAANTITLARGVLTLLLLALLGAPVSEPLAWLVVAVATVAVALDGVDGRLARSRGETSAFGARFDMETDALLILVLAVLVWHLEKASAWIVLAGLLRYVFVAASYPLPWLAAALPPSRRRQTVCVVQIVSLIGALVPLVPPTASAALALAGLAVLVWSFAVDVVWLARNARA